jgi:hypothetical protein
MAFTEIFLLVIFLGATSVYLLARSPIEYYDVKFEDVAASNLVSDHLKSSQILGCLRLMIASVIWYLVFLIYSDKNALKLTLQNQEGKPVLVELKGLGRFATFTVWTWTVQGIYFTLAAAISFSYGNNSLKLMLGESIVQTMIFVCWVLYEVLDLA